MNLRSGGYPFALGMLAEQHNQEEMSGSHRAAGKP